MLLGSHLSISGGLDKAIERADRHGFNALALFVRSPRQWAAPPLGDEAVERFRSARGKSGVLKVVAHASYLINLAGEADQRAKAIRAVAEDLRRCTALGIEYLVLHPGSCPDLALGIRRIADGLNEAFRSLSRTSVRLLLESTAGQGNSIGHRLEHLAGVLALVRRPQRFGVCLDTAHLFAAGYDIRTKRGWTSVVDMAERLIGLDRIHAVHCNDSKVDLGSRVDRHEHIGLGKIGLDGFRHLVNDPRFRDVPLILETPKGTRMSDGRDWDDINADALRALVRKRVRSASARARRAKGTGA